jgi:AcrR family transcriptional regulator
MFIRKSRALLYNIDRAIQFETELPPMSKEQPISSPADSGGDRRTLRTRALLRDSLLELMRERGWDELSVQDVCGRANIGRSTFYLHFPNKEALLRASFEDLRLALKSAAAATNADAAAATFSFTAGLVAHADEHRVLFRSLVGRRSGYVVHQRFKDLVLRMVREELPDPGGDVPREALSRVLASALVELMTWWIEQPRSAMSATQLVALFERFADSVIARPHSRR